MFHHKRPLQYRDRLVGSLPVPWDVGILVGANDQVSRLGVQEATSLSQFRFQNLLIRLSHIDWQTPRNMPARFADDGIDRPALCAVS
jgi:hypothetical protein